MSTPKAIVFDMGDVLFTWDHRVTTQISPKQLHAIVQTDVWLDYERGLISTDDCYRQVAQMFDVTTDELAATFRQTTGSLRPIDKMTLLVQDLKNAGVAVYMMTNIPSLDYNMLRSTDYIWDSFDQIFASGELGMRKPDPCFYERCLQRVGLYPGQVWFVDDKLENVAAARLQGMVGVHCHDVDSVSESLREAFQLP